MLEDGSSSGGRTVFAKDSVVWVKYKFCICVCEGEKNENLLLFLLELSSRTSVFHRERA
jgi:hypothetical protein